MGSSQKLLTRVSSAFSWSGKFSSKKPNFFLYYTVRSLKIPLGQVKKYSGLSRAGLLFTLGQKYGRVGSRPIAKNYESLL